MADKSQKQEKHKFKHPGAKSKIPTIIHNRNKSIMTSLLQDDIIKNTRENKNLTEKVFDEAYNEIENSSIKAAIQHKIA